jgi:hypothetical protein
LLGGEVTDFGIIYRRDKISATMLVEEFPEAHQLDLPLGVHFIYCSDDSLDVAGQILEEGDSIKIAGPVKIMIQSSLGGKLKYIRLLIQEKPDLSIASS